MRRRSAVARLARNVLVGDLKEDFLMTVRMISTLPDTPRQKVRLQVLFCKVSGINPIFVSSDQKLKQQLR